jgi:hypothetical protein
MPSTTTARKVFIPQDMNVQLPATRENPGGRVVQLKQGYVELDETMAAHPLLSRLTPELPDEAKRQERLYEAQQKRDEAVNKAEADLAEVRREVQQERLEATQKASEEYSGRREEALARGASFNEPHPDPETRRAMAMTAPAASFSTMPAAALAQKPQPEPAPGKMPTEAENRDAMRQASEAARPAVRSKD